MDLYPSIDLLGGKVVRLLRGNYDAETVYNDDAVAVAKGFDRDGARWIHVVDLDAARDGGDANLGVIEAICANVSARVQSGGGVRTMEDASGRFAAGVHRVVVGSSAVEHPELVDELCAQHPGRVAVGLDARGQEVAVRGWVEGSGTDLVALGQRFATSGVAALIVTEIGRDGTLEGPDLGQLATVLESVDLPVVASGGVGTRADLQALDGRAVGARRLVGAIVGRALYERRFTVAEGLAALRP